MAFVRGSVYDFMSHSQRGNSLPVLLDAFCKNTVTAPCLAWLEDAHCIVPLATFSQL